MGEPCTAKGFALEGLGGSAVGRRDLGVRQVGLFAEEKLLGVAVETAGAVCLATGCGHLSGFEELFEAAHVLAHNELGVLTEERGQTTCKRTTGQPILHVRADEGAASLWVSTKLDRAAGLDIGVGQRAPGDALVGGVFCDLRVPSDLALTGTEGGPFRTTNVKLADGFKVNHEAWQVRKVTPQAIGLL